jgi:glycosyltransferase involved in cell wall biosynthesis
MQSLDLHHRQLHQKQPERRMSVNQPFVTVATPVYNCGPFIAECIESVLNQTYENFEYLIVNNCSTDDTLEVVQQYAKRDSRIRVTDNTEFLGVFENHNKALNQMSLDSKYCKVVSGDDWIYPECLTKMIALAEAHPGVGIVGSYSLENRRILFQGLDYNEQVVNGRDLCRNTMMGRRPYVLGNPTSLLYRSDLIRRTPTFFPYPKDAPHADVSACYQALQDTDFGFVHQILSFTRIHPQTETSASFKFGRQQRALMADVARFGPYYLSQKETQQQLELFTDKYYLWLVAALLENSFDRRFLEVQRAGLRSIGFELSTTRIMRAAVRRGVEFVHEPGVTSQKLSTILKRKGKIEARGTSLT